MADRIQQVCYKALRAEQGWRFKVYYLDPTDNQDQEIILYQSDHVFLDQSAAETAGYDWCENHIQGATCLLLEPEPV